MRFQSYFNTSVSLIKKYDGSVPLAHFLKQYFSQNKKHGSKDRKFISHLCYCYYRLGHVLKELTPEEKLKAAIYLCNDEAEEWQILFDDSWNEWSENLNDRINFIQRKYHSFSLPDVFPWQDELSETIDAATFAASHLIQPDLFLRIRPNKEKAVVEKLQSNKILFKQLSSTCLSLPNSSKIDSILNIDDEAVVQDYSSQRISEFLKLPTNDSRLPTQLWDCCAASGGKSILAMDVLQNINLIVSDVRSSILQNLKQRFAKAGIKKYDSFVADLTKPTSNIQHSTFNIILCDAPCSGSGTWSRTPEQLFFFDQKKINEYAALQKKIISNTIPHLAKDGYFLYITCSVFKKENEEAVDFILQQFPSLQLIKKEVLKGYEMKADSMFAALFKKA
ncbi:ribosomal RNA small subunit methyltransferase B [mine drainage metagenome]|uniref:Ribosomal RNA small subunit methyltransferase B n=1 Tax=mine drainage metagenome TaxID=410659 RepID=A0A1J5SEL5_9ZZZZ